MWRQALLLAAGVLSLAVQAEIYKMKDAQGNIIYTDTPGDKPAEVINLQPINTQPVIEPGTAPDDVQPPSQEASYQARIISPKDGSTLTGDQRDLPIAVTVTPALGETDELQLLVDGVPYGETTRDNSFVIREIPRGEHNLRVNVLSLQGKTVGSSASVRVFVVRPSVQNPNSPLGGQRIRSN